MKDIKAKLASMRRLGISGTGINKGYDDNVIAMKVKINDGPVAFLDRVVEVEISLDEFLNNLPAEVALRLCESLNKILHPQE